MYFWRYLIDDLIINTTAKVFLAIASIAEFKFNLISEMKKTHSAIYAIEVKSCNVSINFRYIYVICRLGGPYGEKL